MLWERYGMDFIKENGEWKFLHYQVCPEFFALYDIFNPAELKYHNLKEGIPDPPQSAPRYVEDPGPLHKECDPLQPVQNTCPPPLPYAKLDNHNTYTQCDCYDD